MEGLQGLFDIVLDLRLNNYWLKRYHKHQQIKDLVVAEGLAQALVFVYMKRTILSNAQPILIQKY